LTSRSRFQISRSRDSRLAVKKNQQLKARSVVILYFSVIKTTNFTLLLPYTEIHTIFSIHY